MEAGLREVGRVSVCTLSLGSSSQVVQWFHVSSHAEALAGYIRTGGGNEEHRTHVTTKSAATRKYVHRAHHASFPQS